MTAYVGQLIAWEPPPGGGWSYDQVVEVGPDGVPSKMRRLTSAEFDDALEAHERGQR